MARIDNEIRKLFGKAINHYGLIREGDRIAVAVSGGKDSMLLLRLLRDRLRRIPINYELIAVHVDAGFDSGETAGMLESYFLAEGVAYEIIRTDFGVRAHSPENRENPCFLCARLRRSALFRKARELGCAKIAFGHNQDDLIETFFINICYGAQVAGMVPKQEFFGGEITAIRPLSLLSAPSILKMCRRLEIPIFPSGCPSACRNQRAEMREMLEAMYRKNPKVRGNIFHAMSNVNWEYLPPGLPGRGNRGPAGNSPRLEADPYLTEGTNEPAE
ncbi:MAG: ATP-binding protein [Syntrophobacter sp.]